MKTFVKPYGGGQRFPINNSKDVFYDVDATDLERITFIPAGLGGESGKMKFFLPKNPDEVSSSIWQSGKSEEYFMADVITYDELLRKAGINSSDVKVVKFDIE